MERLQKIIAQSGITSRRKAEQLILDGRVKVDGKVITTLGYQAKKGAFIEVDNKPIAKEEKVYYVMNKPKKTICSANDEKGRETIFNYIQSDKRLFTVGRLDYDTTGTLILTNDGEFANEIIHPRYHLEKVYEVTIKGVMSVEQANQMAAGIELEDGLTQKSKVRILATNLKKETTQLVVTIYEGRNRQIKRMFEYFGYEVVRLHRQKLGTLDVYDLHQGEYRKLKMYEIKKLKNLVINNQK